MDNCRLCSQSTEMFNLFTLSDDIKAKFSSTFKIHLQDDQNLPNNVCQDCVDRIEESYTFCKHVSSVQRMLKGDGNDQDPFSSESNLISMKQEVFDEPAVVFENVDDFNRPSHSRKSVNDATLFYANLKQIESIGNIPSYLQSSLIEMGFESAGSFRSLDNHGLSEVYEQIEARIRNPNNLTPSLKIEIAKYRQKPENFSLPLGHKGIIKVLRNHCASLSYEKPAMMKITQIQPQIVTPPAPTTTPTVNYFSQRGATNNVDNPRSEEEIEADLLEGCQKVIDRLGSDYLKSIRSKLKVSKNKDGFWIKCPDGCRQLRAQIAGPKQRIKFFNYERHVKTEHPRERRELEEMTMPGDEVEDGEPVAKKEKRY